MKVCAAEDKYSAWINTLIQERFKGEPERTYGKCKELAKEMRKAFPELVIVKGHVECPHPWNRRSHWWLRAPDGTIVDPSAGQFPGIYEYDEYKEGDPIRIGSCANCGDAIWGPPGMRHPTVCSPTCHEEYMAYLNSGMA